MDNPAVAAQAAPDPDLALLQYIETLQIHLEPGRLDTMVARLRGALGTFVLKTWQFEQDIANIPAQAEDWERVSGAAIDYGDIVQVAHAHSQFGHGGYAGPPLTELKAFQKFSISKLGPGYSLELLAQSQQEINEVLGILQG